MEKIAKFIAETYLTNIEAEMKLHNRIASGRSLKMLKVTDDGQRVTVRDGTGEEQYWQYIDKGRRKGGRPPISKLVEWVRIKLKISDLKEQLSAAWAIATNIAKNGVPSSSKSPVRPSFGLLDRVAAQTMADITPELRKYHHEQLMLAMQGKYKA